MAVKFLRARRRWGIDRLAREMPHVWRAVQLHENRGPSTWLMESRLLARQTANEIAALVSVSPATVSIYEQLFFSVADRLDARMYITKLAIGLIGAGTRENHQPAGVLKWFAYFGGPGILDVVAPILLDGLPAVRTEPIFAAKVKLLASLLTLPDDGDPRRLINLMFDLTKTTRVGGTDSQSPFLDVCEQFVAENCIEVPISAPENAAPEPVEPDTNAANSKNREAA
jgi:hypothetical protein